MKAFYFAEDSKRLRYGDNRKIRVGTAHSVEGDLQLCENGLHASKRLIDALQYAPGPILYLVELSGEIVESEDKLCARKRKYLAEFDAEETLRKFARKQALINIEKIKPYASDSDYKLILRWLHHGNPKIQSAARSSAWSAARSSAELAAESAAWSAAWSAAESAAESAAWSAARSSAESAARSSAESAAWSAADKMLRRMVKKETGWDI